MKSYPHRNCLSKALLALLTLVALTSCSKDEVSQTFSTLHHVFVTFNIVSYTELNSAMSSPGQFVSIRSSQRQLEDATGRPKGTVNGVDIANALGSRFYQLDKQDVTSFHYGLAGIMVGINYDYEPLAYDLGCPNCNYNNDKCRLRITTEGTCSCPNCHIVYDLNHYGVIVSTEGNTIHASPRGLYRYRIGFDGSYITIYN